MGDVELTELVDGELAAPGGPAVGELEDPNDGRSLGPMRSRTRWLYASMRSISRQVEADTSSPDVSPMTRSIMSRNSWRSSWFMSAHCFKSWLWSSRIAHSLRRPEASEMLAHKAKKAAPRSLRDAALLVPTLLWR